MTTEATVERLRELLAKATPGPDDDYDFWDGPDKDYTKLVLPIRRDAEDVPDGN